MKNPFKVGDRVLWTKACPNMCSTGGGGITCFAPPCDTTPGTVIGVGAGVRDPNPGGHIVDNPADLVVVRHDSGGEAGWTADALVYEDPTKRAQGPGTEGPGLGMALAVGLGAVGLVGLGLYLVGRQSNTELALLTDQEMEDHKQQIRTASEGRLTEARRRWEEEQRKREQALAREQERERERKHQSLAAGKRMREKKARFAAMTSEERRAFVQEELREHAQQAELRAFQRQLELEEILAELEMQGLTFEDRLPQGLRSKVDALSKSKGRDHDWNERELSRIRGHEDWT